MRGLSLFCLAIAGAPAIADPVKLLPTSLELPHQIGPLRHDDKPRDYGDPRLGRSYGYYANGLILTVYVYDKGITDLPDGGDTKVVCEEVEAVKHDIQRVPDYQNVKLVGERLARLVPAQDRPLAREAVYELDLKSTPSFSYVWITVADRHFVKLRLSVNAQMRDELPEARRALLDALGAAVEPHLAPVEAPKPQATNQSESGGKGDITLVINSELAEKDKALGLTYLLAIAARAGDAPESMPACGGEVVPTFAMELSAYRLVLQVAHESKVASPLARALQRIDADGFLDEFVWADLHRDSWGSATAADLEPEKFERWRKKHLKNFEASPFGRVVFQSPRPIEIEPAQ